MFQKEEKKGKKTWGGGSGDSAEQRETGRSQPDFNCLLRKCKRFYWCLKEDRVNERPIVSTSLQRSGGGGSAGWRIVQDSWSFETPGLEISRLSCKILMKEKAVFLHRKKGKKRESPAAQCCLHKRPLCEVTKLEVMALRKYRKCDCFHSSKRENRPRGQ